MIKKGSERTRKRKNTKNSKCSRTLFLGVNSEIRPGWVFSLFIISSDTNTIPPPPRHRTHGALLRLNKEEPTANLQLNKPAEKRERTKHTPNPGRPAATRRLMAAGTRQRALRVEVDNPGLKRKNLFQNFVPVAWMDSYFPDLDYPPLPMSNTNSSLKQVGEGPSKERGLLWA